MQNELVKEKFLGIDYGDFTIGLAVFDFETDFIYPYKTICRKKSNILRKSIREIVEIVEIEKITKIVIGYPLNMDDTKGDRILKVENFKRMLENKTNLEIIFQDERLTTIEAKEILNERGIKKENHKNVIDQIAAEIILRDYKNEINIRRAKCLKKI